jgi:hypothetical protein
MERGEGRWFWRVGNDAHVAVGMAGMWDVVAGRIFREMLEFEGEDQRYWGQGFWGMESLG